MPDLKVVNQKVREFVRTVLAMPANSVRPANQNVPTTTVDQQFASVLITLIEPSGWDDSRLENEASPSTNVVESIVGQRRFVASVQFFRGNAYSQACRLYTLMSMSSSVALLQAAGLGFIRASAAKNLTTVIDTYWEERGQIDLEFYLVAKETASTATYGRFPVSVNTNSSTTSSEVTAP
jgi:hypothetical protein